MIRFPLHLQCTFLKIELHSQEAPTLLKILCTWLQILLRTNLKWLILFVVEGENNKFLGFEANFL